MVGSNIEKDILSMFGKELTGKEQYVLIDYIDDISEASLSYDENGDVILSFTYRDKKLKINEPIEAVVLAFIHARKIGLRELKGDLLFKILTYNPESILVFSTIFEEIKKEFLLDNRFLISIKHNLFDVSKNGLIKKIVEDIINLSLQMKKDVDNKQTMNEKISLYDDNMAEEILQALKEKNPSIKIRKP